MAETAEQYRCACPPGRCLAVESVFNGGQLAEFAVAGPRLFVGVYGAAVVIQNNQTVLSGIGCLPSGVQSFEARCDHH